MATQANVTFETDTEHHVNWFDTTVVRSTADFHSGAASLLVTITAQFAGVVMDNSPASFSGFTGGNSYDFSIWCKQSAATMPNLDWELTWYDGGGTSVGTDNITIPASTSWTQTTATKVAPAGAVNLTWAFEDHGNGNTGAAWYMDDIVVQDSAGGGGGGTPPRPAIVVPGLAAIQAASW